MAMKNTKRIVLLAIMVSQALVLSIIESWIPIPVPVPGVKLGLANIITMIVIMFFGIKDALLVVVVRCALSSAYGGGLMVFLFSIAGGVLSAIVMFLLHRKLSKVFSTVGISIAGAVSHNIGQLAVACVVMKELLVMTYLPVLMASGVVTGCFVGICSNLLAGALKKTNMLAD